MWQSYLNQIVIGSVTFHNIQLINLVSMESATILAANRSVSVELRGEYEKNPSCTGRETRKLGRLVNPVNFRKLMFWSQRVVKPLYK